MSVSEITKPVASVPITPPIGSAFLDMKSIPWSPWVMDGTEFKLLNINPMTGGFSMMLRVDENNYAPVHGHTGSVEGIITKGAFGYGEDVGLTGAYVLENGGINHSPHTLSEGMEMFAVVHGPLVGFGDDGGVGAVVDAKLMYQMAKEGGAADHITPPEHWTDI